MLITIIGILFGCQDDIQNTHNNDPNRIGNNYTENTTNDSLKRGIVNTFIEGKEFDEVPLWSTNDENRWGVGSLKNNEKVIILKDIGDYYYIENSIAIRAYCEKKFIKINK